MEQKKKIEYYKNQEKVLSEAKNVKHLMSDAKLLTDKLKEENT